MSACRMIRGATGAGPRAGRAALTAAVAVLLALVVTSASVAAPRRPPHFAVRSAIVVDGSTGEVVYADAPDARLPIASTTKLMTALLTLERARLDAVFTAPAYNAAPAESVLGLRPGERMRVRDLLRALLLPSANDAAVTLARGVGGSQQRFVDLMNRRARTLGLRHTHYSNPVGLDSRANYSSARDLVTLARYLRRNRFFDRTVDSKRLVLTSGDHRRTVVNRDTLLFLVPWANGVKTGHTSGAEYVLVGSGTRHGLTFISAVLGAPTEDARNGDSLGLLRYAFAAFARATLVRRGQVVARPALRDRPGQRVDVVAGGTVVRLLRRGELVRRTLHLPRELAGPLPRHARVGTMVVRVRGRVVASVPLLTARAIPAVGALTRVGRWLGHPATLVVLGAIAISLSLALAHRSRSRRRRQRARRRRRPSPDIEPA